MVGVLILAATTLSAGLGGRVMREGTRAPRYRPAPVPAELGPATPAVAAVRLGPPARARAVASHDVFALAGD
jgi:hypothetical protein